MKRKLSLFLFLMMFMASLLPCFLPCKQTKSLTQTTYSLSAEDEFYGESSQDLISINPQVITNGKVENIAPFDAIAKKKMEGSSITPTADDCGQFKNKEFGITAYTPTEDDVIYMWVYLINVLTFKFTVSLGGVNNSSIVWEFDSSQVFDMGSGWKIIALDLDSHSENLGGTFNTISFSYYSEMNDYTDEEEYQEYNEKTNERFSFYHVFVTKSEHEQKPHGVVFSLGKTFYEISDTFSIDKNVYIGDSVVINSATEVFKYLYIGKYDLSNFVSSGVYYWRLSIKSPGSVTTKFTFGDKILFSETGFYQLTIRLYETGVVSTDVILNETISIYCDELALGKFTMGSKYTFKDDGQVVITFKLASGIELTQDIDISLENKNAQVDSYYEEDGTIYIYVSGVSSGTCKMDISAKAKTKYNTKTQDFTASATLEIESTEKQVDVFMVILWSTFACFCIGFLIYLLISLVKSRKNDVK